MAVSGCNEHLAGVVATTLEEVLSEPFVTSVRDEFQVFDPFK